MAKYPHLKLEHTSLRIAEHMLDMTKLEQVLGHHEFAPVGPTIVDFQPVLGYAGTLMVIAGSGFAEERRANHVEVGGRPALVVASEVNRLVIITHHQTQTGPVTVTVDGLTATGPQDFEVLSWPEPSTGDDGPPYSFAGVGPGTSPSAGTVPPTGTARILVVLCHPTDLVPPNPANTRTATVNAMSQVSTYYDQASYEQLNVEVDVTNFVALLNDANYYHRQNGGIGYPNIDEAVNEQLIAECAQGAVDQGFDLDDYSVMVASIYLPGYTVRAWGGWSQSNFAYNNGAGVSIDITTANPLGMIVQRHDADWGRTAHEFGHNLVDGGLVLGEDVYRSDLIDSSEATADSFELMGNHDSHPLYSGFYMHQLGWYDPANILDLTWDRNPFSQEYEIVAHGLTQNTTAGRYHLIRIQVSSGLYYFIEVRQRPDPGAATPQVFDANIPLPMGGSPDGGVVVTKVISGVLNNNQETRLITLLQEHERVMITGEEAIDPVRTLYVTVVDDDVEASPRVCRLRVEWAQVIPDTPGGDFDLRIEPWGPGYETPDIWIDRSPFGVYDYTDAMGNPTGNGDVPRPLEINRFEARIRNDGTAQATDVQVTHYVVEPPGVGDNGNWDPEETYTIPSIPAGGSVSRNVNWVPLLGEHTCLKVAIAPQLGEITTGNNAAQENIFVFQPPAASVPAPVTMTVAVRNPLPERSMVMISLQGVPGGYYAYFPHRWLWLDGLAERKLDLLIIPLIDIQEMKDRRAHVRLFGRVPHMYSEKLEMTGYPASWMAPIGGIQARVLPKHHSEIRLSKEVCPEKGRRVRVDGQVTPHLQDQELRVDMTRPDHSVVVAPAKTDRNGNFSAVFRLGLIVNKPKSRRRPGVYQFQAHVINATLLAPADSNIVWFTDDRLEQFDQEREDDLQ